MRKTGVRLRKCGKGHVGELSLPMAAGRINIATVGWDPISALKRASAAALTIVNDPRLMAVLPPQAAIAAKAIHEMTKMSTAELQQTKAEAKKDGDKSTAKIADKLIDSRRQYTGDVGLDLGRGRRRKPVPAGGRVVRDNRGNRAGGYVLKDQNPERYQGSQYTAPAGRVNINTRGPQQQMEVVDPTNPHGYASPDPNAYPQPYGGGGAPPTYGGGGEQLSPEDYIAMQAWGAEAYGDDAFRPQDSDADPYFEGYEEVYDPSPYDQVETEIVERPDDMTADEE